VIKLPQNRGTTKVLYHIEVHKTQSNEVLKQINNIFYSPFNMTEASKQTMKRVFGLCRKDDWLDIFQMLQDNPEIGTTTMIMDNHISTTILHQAITSKAKTQDRARVIEAILDLSPSAATIKNGYGSLPLHVISQRNTKMDSVTKERLIHALVQAFPKALMTEGGVGRRTPLHIAFTDYISPKLAKMMIEKGSDAAFMKDKKGWLPIHVAVSRHCSPEKLRLLLKANPNLHATTALGETLLDLAQKTATKSHPNFALIAELERQLGISGPAPSHEEELTEPIPYHKQRPVRAAGTRKRKAEAANLLLHFSRTHLQEQEEKKRRYQHYPSKPKYFRPVREDDPFDVSYGDDERKPFHVNREEYRHAPPPTRKGQYAAAAIYRHAGPKPQQLFYNVKEEEKGGVGGSYHDHHHEADARQELFHPPKEETKQGPDVFYSPPPHDRRYRPPQYSGPPASTECVEPKPAYYPNYQMFYTPPQQPQDLVGEIVQL
jgi:hypothetical protein